MKTISNICTCPTCKRKNKQNIPDNKYISSLKICKQCYEKQRKNLEKENLRLHNENQKLKNISNKKVSKSSIKQKNISHYYPILIVVIVVVATTCLFFYREEILPFITGQGEFFKIVELLLVLMGTGLGNIFFSFKIQGKLKKYDSDIMDFVVFILIGGIFYTVLLFIAKLLFEQYIINYDYSINILSLLLGGYVGIIFLLFGIKENRFLVGKELKEFLLYVGTLPLILTIAFFISYNNF